ncbi:hypothetical protein ETU10_02585 [Apibacter muscae]|uniref:hypothetical protein n=1 Tax=Apibacter muscae TaxID=2509004 RepID=UPI0011AE0139|nr:hypothetical protein [Apibacter muscae]TWP24867.1 hypothetical protein ETU10_02585 [Apibacter muscae]
MSDVDILVHKRIIGYSKGITEFGAMKNMHVYGGNSLITALNKIEYKAPDMNEVTEPGKFIHDDSPQIVEMFWSYGDDYVRLNEKSRFYVDMNLHVLTRNYKLGESIDFVLKNDDDTPLAEELDTLELSGVVDEDNQIIFKDVFKDYTLNLTKEDPQQEEEYF